jgi:integrase
MARKATGQLILRETGYFGRYWAIVDGKRTRISVPLNTFNRDLAEQELARLVAASASPKDAGIETFGEAVERVHPLIIESHVDNARQQGVDADHIERIRMYAKDEIARLRKYAVPVIGEMPITEVSPADVCSALRFCREKMGKSHQTMLHLKKHMQDVFAELRRAQLIERNPVRDIDPDDLPRAPTKNARRKPRAVLTDAELGIFLRFSSKHHHHAVRSRQVMSMLARVVGGMRTGDLHGLRWDDLDARTAKFETIFVPREKTGEPDWFCCPDVLRPFLLFWWHLNDCPVEGLVFPASRGDRKGARKIKVSHARGLKRDVAAAFVAARAAGVDAPEKGSDRWAQLFSETSRTRPLDFHSWRRSFVQQTRKARRELDKHSMPLSGHRSSTVHQLYAMGISNEVQTIPAESLPQGLEGIADAWYDWWRSINALAVERAARKGQSLVLSSVSSVENAIVPLLSTQNYSGDPLPALCHAGGRGFESRPPRQSSNLDS